MCGNIIPNMATMEGKISCHISIFLFQNTLLSFLFRVTIRAILDARCYMFVCSC